MKNNTNEDESLAYDEEEVPEEENNIYYEGEDDSPAAEVKNKSRDNTPIKQKSSNKIIEIQRKSTNNLIEIPKKSSHNLIEIPKLSPAEIKTPPNVPNLKKIQDSTTYQKEKIEFENPNFEKEKIEQLVDNKLNKRDIPIQKEKAAGNTNSNKMNNYLSQQYNIPYTKPKQIPQNKKYEAQLKKHQFAGVNADSDSDSDINIELEGNSKQVRDFENSIFGDRVTKKKKAPQESSFNKIDNTDDIEQIYISKLKAFQEENRELRKKLEEKPSTTTEVEDLKQKLEKKSRDYIEYKSKYETLLFEYEVLQKKFNDIKGNSSKNQTDLQERDNQIASLKSENRAKDEALSKLVDENSKMKEQIDSNKREITNNINETNKKNNKIIELQERVLALDQEKQEINAKSSSELKSLRENKQNYDTLRLTYTELKNQYDVIYLKLQSLNDENYNIKRDYLLAKNSIDTKKNAEMGEKDFLFDKTQNYTTEKNHSKVAARGYGRIESQDQSIPGNKNSNINPVRINNMEMSSNNTIINTISNETPSMLTTTKSSLSVNLNVNNSLNNINIVNNKNKANECCTSLSIFPSQQNIIGKESKINEIETILYNLQQEKDKVTNDLAKLPEFPKQKAQILKKRNLELVLSEFSQKINKQKQELRELNALNRDY